jgi:Ni/Co efflux regulator RcnB
MKTLLIAAAALSVLGATAASAQPGYNQGRDYDRSGQQYDRGDYRNDRGDRGYDRSDRGDRYDRSDRRYDNRGDSRYDRNRSVRRYSRGEHLPRNYWSQQYVVSDWRARNLRQPPRGYQWRRVNNDYVLAAVATGLIASIIAGY